MHYELNKLWNFELRLLNFSSKFKVQSSKFKVQSSEFKVQGSEFYLITTFSVYVLPLSKVTFII